RERPLPHLAALALREHDVGTGPGVRHGDVRSAAEPFLEPREQLETQLVVVVVDEELDQQLDDRVEVAPFAGGKRRESTRDGERERAGDGERGALVVRSHPSYGPLGMRGEMRDLRMRQRAPVDADLAHRAAEELAHALRASDPKVARTVGRASIARSD